MNETVRPCPACQRTDPALQGRKNGFDINVCRGCRTIYTSQLPAENETEDYDAYYTDLNLTVPDFIAGRLREIVGQFEPYRKNNRLLDIGFGSGTILREALRQGWDAWGTEVSATACRHAERSGYNVIEGTLKDAAFESDSIDVVTASEILEHLPDPVGELAEIWRILRPGGLFWATTPSARSLSFRLMNRSWTVISPPEHTQLYSRAGATLMLKNAGFSNIRISALGLNPSEIISYYRSPDRSTSGFNRVGSGYELNEKLTSSPARQKIKSGLNSVLDLFEMGDSLKIFARKGDEPDGK